MSITVRPETESDYDIIWQLTKTAFSGKLYAAGDEQDLIDTLRRLNALTLSLVAVENDQIIGQITFSEATVSSGIGQWYALGPISVRPDRQGEGIGGELIEAGIQAIGKLGAWGCILTGDPRYYTRHGFEYANEHCPEKEPEEYFMIRQIGDQQPIGVFAFHPAFYTDI